MIICKHGNSAWKGKNNLYKYRNRWNASKTTNENIFERIQSWSTAMALRSIEAFSMASRMGTKVGIHHKKSDLRAHMMHGKFFVFRKDVEEVEPINCSIPEIKWIISWCGTSKTLKTWQRGRILWVFSGRIKNQDWARRMVRATFTLPNILTKAVTAWKVNILMKVSSTWIYKISTFQCQCWWSLFISGCFEGRKVYPS